MRIKHQEELDNSKGIQEYTFEEKIALHVSDEHFKGLHRVWARSTLIIIALKYPDTIKKHS